MAFEKNGGFENRNLLAFNAFSPEVLTALETKVERKTGNNRPKLEDFAGLYSKEDIEKDLAYIKNKEIQFSEKYTDDAFGVEHSVEEKKIASIAEAIVTDKLEGWLGGKGICIPTSLYDDYKHGVDVVIEFPEGEDTPNSYLGLGLDVTTGKSDILEGKLKRIRSFDVDQEKNTTLKYFDSEEIRGALEVPRVVLAIDKEVTLPDLFKLEYRGKTQELLDHPFQYVALYQLFMQCNAFALEAQAKGKQKSFLLYGHANNMLHAILEERKDEFFKHKDLIFGDATVQKMAKILGREDLLTNFQ